MNANQVALQLYTLRDYMKTREDVAFTLKRVVSIGYPAIQISGMPEGLYTEAEMVELCRELGLVICATHEPSDRVLAHPEQVVERLRGLDCAYTAYPFPRDIDFGSEQSVANLIKGLHASGKTLADAGQVLTYHNHHHEFRKLNGRLILERLYDETDPRYVQGELDTYWVQFGGGDPVDWCRRLKNRLPLLHLKDYKINDDAKVTYAPIGEGNLHWPAIIEAAEEAGCLWYIVEQDTCEGDVFDSVARSLDFINQHLVS